MNPMCLYEQVMGSGFGKLDEPVQVFHRLTGQHTLHGSVETRAPASWLARCLGRCLGTPLHDRHGPIRFELHAQPACELWIRHFPTKTMRSRLSLGQHRLVEQLGAAELTFGLEESEGTLVMRLERLRFMGLPCPSWAMPNVIAEENGKDGRLHFKVSASVPIVGLVTSYTGYLDIEPEVPK